ncbi:MAG: hypothetical protein IPL99_29480 [Candidatus Competibacteraceae bacterium]|nr:hypothetical protein [Candidatus Competibacteraceae bacterium]
MGTDPRRSGYSTTGRLYPKVWQGPKPKRDLAKRYQDIADRCGAGFGGIAGGTGDRRAGVHPHPTSQFDIWTLGRMDDQSRPPKGFNPEIAGVGSQPASTNPQPTRSRKPGTCSPISSDVQLSSAVIRDRIAYRKAARDGLSVEELKPTDPKAGEENTGAVSGVFHGGG